MKEHPTINNWFIGGHSLGGVVASSYAYNHQSKVKGLILLAAYLMNKNDFSNTNYPILSLTGDKDGLSTPNKISETKHLLSKNTKIVKLKGANNAQFGLYGEQIGDNKATISPEEQQKQMVQRLNEQIK
ncbi:alpha/beta fold hydrolase [Priestia flexa]|nr:alpha/beta fold hydrolase [Priestia flexa]MED3825388.1 alpha/beta fold hydrolase [Priestia flexa]